MIAVIDYEMGNLHSVRNALWNLGADVTVTSDPAELRRAERIVLPGVGAFGECMKNLRSSGIVKTLTNEVRDKGKPLLGICLGMQVLATMSNEMGHHEGLGWLPMRVDRFAETDRIRIPHVGWNEVLPAGESPMFSELGSAPTFYFTHSYYPVAEDDGLSVAYCDYGRRFTAAVCHGNIFGTQFHPEKSQRNGLQLLHNFMRWTP